MGKMKELDIEKANEQPVGKKMRTAWRKECLCPKCKVEIDATVEGSIPCPKCGIPLFVQKKEYQVTEYLVLS